ncbi:hypothetical protein [Anaerovorax sp. IOR16]|uniref:hypothetical protein n=1 Tax=Anaerovorax sp. IOR16 TaxID=2773458 RepID=UPI001FD6A261|nr:hypothetical protein [Anaerovorax sp. IOR16]
MKMENVKLNASGCKDLTAYKALKPMIKSDAAVEKKVHKLIENIKYIINLAGFELAGRIKLKDKKSGREFK